MKNLIVKVLAARAKWLAHVTLWRSNTYTTYRSALQDWDKNEKLWRDYYALLTKLQVKTNSMTQKKKASRVKSVKTGKRRVKKGK